MPARVTTAGSAGRDPGGVVHHGTEAGAAEIQSQLSSFEQAEADVTRSFSRQPQDPDRAAMADAAVHDHDRGLDQPLTSERNPAIQADGLAGRA